ncbi:MAG: UvrB/UvrC motif-containing protein, partial [Phycisphaerae bacterium]|nr:UvrB/UvrC motif-containing protein [Phycisphaerae bacterium]
ADTVTPAMQLAIDETNRRREAQMAYNKEHGITPVTIQKAIRSGLESEVKARKTVQDAIKTDTHSMDVTEIVKLLEEEMLQAAQNLEFERAAQLRDKINELKGAPTITNGRSFDGSDPDDDGKKIWQPKSKGRPKRRIAK